MADTAVSAENILSQKPWTENNRRVSPPYDICITVEWSHDSYDSLSD